LSGVNEDLGATAVYGSQLANLFPQPKYDGVLGMWYGKGPGVDRTGDIFKHANFAGVGKHGGVLALGGDDPLSKSSTIPSHSEVAFYDALFPVLYPGSAQEILDLGRLGFELSRYSGLWVGFKIVTNVADEIGTAEVSPDRIVVAEPSFLYEGRPWQATQNPILRAALGRGAEGVIHSADGLRRRRPSPRQPSSTASSCRRRTRGSASRPRARRTTTCARPSPSSAWTMRRSASTASGSCRSRCCSRWSPARCASSPAGSRSSWSSRRSARSASSSSATSSITRPSARGWSASTTSRAARSCRPTASSTPTASPRSWRRGSSAGSTSTRLRRAWRCSRHCVSGRRP